MASLKPSKQRKGSSPATKTLLGAAKPSSLADSTLFSLLNVINLDDICHQTFPINVWLTDEPPKELTVNRFSVVKDAIQEFCKEHKIERPVVKIKATRAPISLDSKAALLENHEIIIEDLKNDAKEFKEAQDPRLVNLKALVNSEEKYLESLKITVELYGGLLKNTSLNHLDHQIIFERLKPIQETSGKLLAKLKALVESWNPDSCVASAFSDFPDILWVYENYYSRLSQAKRLLRQKCKYDGEFFAVVHEINITAKASLGLLILLPARRILEYKNYLVEAIECSPEDHDDRHKLKVVIERIEQTLLERKEEVDEVENEFHLIEIQDKFPHDDLGLDEEKGVSGQKFIKQPLGRRKSAPVGTGIKAAFSKANKSSVHSIDISLTIHSDSGSLSPDNCCIYLDECAVQLTTGVGSHDRYMFLFNDFLLIAKSKSPTHYKLKCRIKLSDIWLADCIEDITESVKYPEKSFVIGWPTENYAASFSTVEERNKWHEALTSNIASQKELQDPKSIVIKVGYKESETYQHLTKTLSVGHLDDANKVVQMALDHFNLPNKETNEFQLWVLFKDGAYPLIGHEFPFAIQLNQHREFSIMDDTDLSAEISDSINNNTSSTTTSAESSHSEGQLQFLLKRSRKLHSKSSSKRWMRNPIPWKTSKKHSGSKSFDITSPIGKVFGLPLEQLTSEEELVPKPINELLIRLFRYAPSTPGIFRKTPNQRAVKEMRETIDEEKELNLEGTSVHAVAGLMKEYLRRLPDAVCCSENYEDFLASNNLGDKNERIQEIKRILDLLPSCNHQLIKRFICVLYHISKNSENNNMTSFNLAVCVSPSMLRPPQSVTAESVEQAKITAPQFFEFLIDNFPEIFGNEAITVLGDVSEIVVDVPQVNEDGGESEVDLEVNVDENHIKGVDNDDTSGSLLDIKTRPMSRSMPSSPVSLRKLMDKNNDTSRRIQAAFYHPKFSPRSSKKRLERSSATDASDESLTSNEPEPENSNQCVPGLKPPVILTTTTTSAELIKHVPSAEDCLKKRSASFNGTEGTDAQDIRKVAASKQSGLNFATSQNFFVAPAHVAERVYCVDRRRQPAAPSYKEHMQRQRTGSNSHLSPSSAEQPVGSKSMETKMGTTLTPARALILEPRLLPLFGSLSPAGSDGSGKRSTGSISSLSSNEELSADPDTNTPSKPDVTQLKHIQDLLDVSGYANPLRINPETMDMISQTEGQWENHAQDDCQDIDDYQRMTMAEETYV